MVSKFASISILWPIAVQVHCARIKGASNDVAVKVILSSTVASRFPRHFQVSCCRQLPCGEKAEDFGI